MNHVQPILIAAACVLALSACASEYPVQRVHAPASVAPATSGMIEPAAAEGSAYGAGNTGGTYPYGTGQAADQEPTQGEPQQVNAEVTEGIVVIGPDGTVWLRAEEEDPAYRGDVESCYAYARGQVEHDVRIESDVASAFDTDGDGFGLAALRGRMNHFERTNRVPELVSSCLSSKGYSRR
jgi:hypothetical protein